MAPEISGANIKNCNPYPAADSRILLNLFTLTYYPEISII